MRIRSAPRSPTPVPPSAPTRPGWTPRVVETIRDRKPPLEASLLIAKGHRARELPADPEPGPPGHRWTTVGESGVPAPSEPFIGAAESSPGHPRAAAWGFEAVMRTSERDRVEGRGSPPNLVVVVLDCARALSFRPGGLPRTARAPNLEGLASRGTTFERAVAPSNWTLPSHMSIMTGTYPSVHRLRTFRRDLVLPETIQAWLGRRGYDTALFTETLHLVGGWGLETGFAERFSRAAGGHGEDRTLANEIGGHTRFLYSSGMRRLVERIPATVLPVNLLNYPQETAYKARVCGEYLLEEMDRWLERRTDARPFYAMVNFADAHEPYPDGIPEEQLGWMEKQFARTPRFYLLAVAALQGLVPWSAVAEGYVRALERGDEKLGRLVDILERHGAGGRTMVVVTSDHGQAFGERGIVYHGCGGTESVTRVPLVVAPAEGTDLPRRVPGWVSLCDLASWLKASALGQPPFDADGSITVPFPVSPPGRRIVYCEAGPASDPNHSLVGIGTDREWNRRQIVAYIGETKLQLDLSTGEVVRWGLATDPDSTEGERLTGASAEAVRRNFFFGYSGADPLAPEAGFEEFRREELGDEQMRSWGYD
jgi:arylsulfatase A-like enzyme